VAVERMQVGHGLLKKHESDRIVRYWKSGAGHQAIKRKPEEFSPEELARMGLGANQ
jgi:hypothetical protein